MNTSSEFEKVGFSNLCSGAASELFDRELGAVLQNIADPNAKAKVARTITLTVTILPTEDRARGVIGVKCTSKLAPADGLEHSIDLVQEGRSQVAYQRTAKSPGAPVSKIGG